MSNFTNKKNKLLIYLMALFLVFNIFTTFSFGATETGGVYSRFNTASTVSYNFSSDSNYLVTVPETVTVGDTSSDNDVFITGYCVRDISINTEPIVEMTTQTGNVMNATASFDSQITMRATAIGSQESASGNLIVRWASTAPIILNWSGTVIYKVEQNHVSTNYTLNEIEANDHLFAIGATKPEYVVAKYNSDYSEVTITKNGTDSDGLMEDNTYFYIGFKNKHASAITSAIIDFGIFNIGNEAFKYCANLNSIYIPDSVTRIGYNVFTGCTSLISINIPDSVVDIHDNAFKDCDNLTINCETSSQPSTWYPSWNPNNRPVNWGVSM